MSKKIPSKWMPFVQEVLSRTHHRRCYVKFRPGVIRFVFDSKRFGTVIDQYVDGGILRSERLIRDSGIDYANWINGYRERANEFLIQQSNEQAH